MHVFKTVRRTQPHSNEPLTWRDALFMRLPTAYFVAHGPGRLTQLSAAWIWCAIARAIRTASLARALLTSRGRLHAQMLPTSSPPPPAWMTRSATSRRSSYCACVRSFSCEFSRSLSLQCSRSLVQFVVVATLFLRSKPLQSEVVVLRYHTLRLACYTVLG